jgi:hypothetical protein
MPSLRQINSSAFELSVKINAFPQLQFHVLTYSDNCSCPLSDSLTLFSKIMRESECSVIHKSVTIFEIRLKYMKMTERHL